jgi:hypothetical protein
MLELTLTMSALPLARSRGSASRVSRMGAEIDLDHLADLRFARRLEPAGPDAARIIDEDVETAQRLGDGGERLGPGRAIRNVTGDGHDRSAERCGSIG